MSEESPLKMPQSAPVEANRLELFHGEANPAVARVYARLTIVDEAIDLTSLELAGRLRGPECAFSHTLPLRMPFLPCPPRNSAAKQLVAEAVVPDPCFWTPELPFLYRAQIELMRREELLWRCERLVGIRRLGVRGQSLLFDGKRFVLRGLVMQVGIAELGEANEEKFARESWTAIVAANPNDEFCEWASRRGILLGAELTKLADESGARDLDFHLRRLSHWPAVGIAVLNRDGPIPNAVCQAAPNLLLAQHIAADEPINLAEWAHLAMADVDKPRKFARKVADCQRPIVAVRQLSQPASIEQARAGCDALQHDLSIAGDFAGYVV